MSLTRDRWLLVGILLVGAAVRLPELESAPPAINNDIAFNGTDALSLLQGEFRIFFPGNFGREPLMIYLQAIGTLLFGRNALALRIPTAFVGLLTIAAIAPLAYRLFLSGGERIGRAASLLAAALLAASCWHLYYSRVGWRATLLPFVLIVGIYLLARAFDGDRWAWPAAGAVFGAAFYTYLAARLAPAVPAALLLVERDALRTHRNGAGWFVAALVVIGFPLAAHFAVFPDQFSARLGPLLPMSADTGDLPAANSPVKALLGTLAMFVNDGGDSTQLMVVGRGAFDWLIFPFFLIGLAIAGVRWRERHTRWMLFWFIVMLLPAILARNQHPHYSRAIGALPPAILLATLGLVAVGGWIVRRFPRSPRLIFPSAFALLAVSLGLTVSDYRAWAADPETARAFGISINNVAREANQLDDGSTWFFALAHPGRGSEFQYRALTYLYQGKNGLTVASDLPTLQRVISGIPAGEMVRIYDFGATTRFGPDDPFEVAEFLLAGHGSAQGIVQRDGYRRRDGQILGAPTSLLAQPVRRQLGQGTLDLTGVWFGSSKRSLVVSLIHSPSTGPAPFDRISLRLLDSWGTLVAQTDRPIVDGVGRHPDRWPGPEPVPVYGVLALPGGLPPGRYVLQAAGYRLDSPEPGNILELTAITLPRPTPPTPSELAGLVPLPPPLAGGSLLGWRAYPETVRPALPARIDVWWESGSRGLLAELAFAPGVSPTRSRPIQVPAVPGATLRLPFQIDIPPFAEGRIPIRLVAAGEVVELGELDVPVRARRTDAPMVERPLDVRFADLARLVGYDLEVVTSASPGLDLTLYWQALGDPLPDLLVRIRMLDGGQVIGVREGRPDDGKVPTVVWRAGEFVVDGYELPVSGRDSVSLEIELVDSATGVSIAPSQAGPVRIGPVRLR